MYVWVYRYRGNIQRFTIYNLKYYFDILTVRFWRIERIHLSYFGIILAVISMLTNQPVFAAYINLNSSEI